MLITTAIYVGDNDQVDWEPDSTGEGIIIHFGKSGYARGCKLQMSNKVVRELVHILKSLGKIEELMA